MARTVSRLYLELELLQQNDLPGLGERPRDDLVEIDTARHLLAFIIPPVPHRLTGTGVRSKRKCPRKSGPLDGDVLRESLLIAVVREFALPKLYEAVAAP